MITAQKMSAVLSRSLKWEAACRACDSRVKPTLELLCHRSRGSERAEVSRVNETARYFKCPLMCGVGDSGEWAHVPTQWWRQASCDDDDNTANVISPHVFLPLLLTALPSRSLAFPGHMT